MKKVLQSKSLTFYKIEEGDEVLLPFIEGGIKAGFPSPAEDFTGASIDLNKLFIKNKTATYLARVEGNSMLEAGLNHDDILIVDKSIELQDGKIGVFSIDREFTVKRIKKEKDHVWLLPANSDFDPIKVTEENDFMLWGVITFIIKKVL
jgi:DNA polymerase V